MHNEWFDRTVKDLELVGTHPTRGRLVLTLNRWGRIDARYPEHVIASARLCFEDGEVREQTVWVSDVPAHARVEDLEAALLEGLERMRPTIERRIAKLDDLHLTPQRILSFVPVQSRLRRLGEAG